MDLKVKLPSITSHYKDQAHHIYPNLRTKDITFSGPRIRSHFQTKTLHHNIQGSNSHSQDQTSHLILRTKYHITVKGPSIDQFQTKHHITLVGSSITSHHSQRTKHHVPILCPGHTFTDHLTGSTTDLISRMTPEMPISVVRYGCTIYV